ncbi:MAG: DUF2271 domain-containing protein [Tannerellaceae bacterium]|nr:DUF2271 domain-containing protein [Tannerellaceae bacterium]
MKTGTFLIAFISLFCGTMQAVSSEQTNGKVEITLSFERQEGRGSNQYAIWIQNSKGELVKTLFVTKFTAQKGWEKRPACAPIWVEKANANALSQEQLDGITGATPSTGSQTYVWDGTDEEGNQVTPGTYTFVVEGTLFNENYVLFKGDIQTTGEERSVVAEPEYHATIETHRDMIKQVSARYIP